jgi:hypothetical protein
MRLLISLFFAVLLTAPFANAQAAEPFTNFNVVLLQPSDVLEERVASVDAMAEYIKAVQSALRDAVLASGTKQSVSGFVVVAVRPDLQSKVWLDFDTLLDLEARRQIVTKVLAVKPFEARKGPVVFALKVGLWGAKESRRVAPSPPEWKNVAKGGVRLEVGELVEKIWNE